jgi:hypothetical protein
MHDNEISIYSIPNPKFAMTLSTSIGCGITIHTKGYRVSTLIYVYYY